MNTDTPPCSICGGLPAVAATFRAVLVAVIGMGVRRSAGWYCRDCGMTIFREQTKFTLLAGWWGIPAVATPLFLLLNLAERGKVERLPRPRFAPMPPADAGPRYGRPLPPVAPVRRSPAIIVPIVLIGFLVLLCAGPHLF